MSDLMQVLIPRFNTNEKYPDPDLLMFYKQLETRDIWLDTEISWEYCNFLVQYLNWIDQDENKDPVTIHIMSDGGDLRTMFTIYDTIKKMNTPVITVNEGSCHSAAFIVFLAGHKRAMNKHALFIAHEGSSVLGGSYRESKAAMKQYDAEVEVMKNIIIHETNLTYEQIEEHFSSEADWYIGLEEAKEYGILR